MDGRFLKCENSFFYKYSWGISAKTPSIFQVLEPHVFLLDGGEISSTYQLNELEWSGDMKLKFKAIRVLEEQSSGAWKWGHWVERPNGINIAYAKGGGKWVMTPSMDGVFGEPPEKCDDIPVKLPLVDKKEPGPEKPNRENPLQSKKFPWCSLSSEFLKAPTFQPAGIKC